MRYSSMLVCLLILLATARGCASEEQTALVEAARRGDLAEVQQLLEQGCPVNAQTQFGITALWQASAKGHPEIVRLLLDQGAAVDQADSVWFATPLMLADDAEIVRLLVSAGADGVGNKLNQASLNGSREIVEAILAQMQPTGAMFVSAKAHAELGSHAAIVEVLEEAAGAPIDPPPELSARQLERLRGRYLDERLNEISVDVEDGQLTVQFETGSPAKLIPRQSTVFQRGPTTFHFRLSHGTADQVTRLSGSSRRTYSRPSSNAAAETDRPADDLTQDRQIAARHRWPSFRGPNGRGIAIEQNLPQQWNAEKDQHVAWRTPIPGLAHSCPVVWDDRVFVSTAISRDGREELRIGLYGDVDAAEDESEHRWKLYCLDHQTGKILWQRTAHRGVPPVKRHEKSTQANSTPVTDGQHVAVLFNSGGLYCYDCDGKLLWMQDLGVLDAGMFNDADYQWGFASSPIIVEGLVVVQVDVQQGSYIAAFRAEDGQQVWRTPRDEVSSWGTPAVYQGPTGPVIATNATNHARGYELANGAELWRLSGHAAITVPTPQVARGLIFITSGYRPIQPIYAVRPSAIGDITPGNGEQAHEHLAWSTRRGGPYLPTPIVYGNFLYTCSNNGILSCYHARTGQRVYRKRFARGQATSFSASPVAADGAIYLIAEAGVVYAVQAGPEFERISDNPVGQYCLATPAIAGGLLIVRGQSELIAIGQ